MKAHVEHLAGIVRTGQATDHYGAPFDHAVAYSSADGKTAVIKALTSQGGFTTGHARAVIAALKNIGLSPTWERMR